MLWLMVVVAMVVALWVRFSPYIKQIAPPRAARPVPAVATVQRVAAVPAPPAEEPPPHPAPEPQVWKVLFASPEDGQTGISRRTPVKIFFNGPIERDVAEWAFTISPAAPGTVSWPRPDRLVFAPRAPLLPATRYTVSLTPVRGTLDGTEYELLENRWSFTTGDQRTFAEDIKPLVSLYCQRCHAPKGAAAAVPLDSYTDVSRYVVPNRSGESRFYTFIQERKHHINMAGPTHSTNSKLAVIKDWIDEDGAAP